MNIRLFFAKSVFRSRRAQIYKQVAFALSKDATPRSEFEAMAKNSEQRRSAIAPVFREWTMRLATKAAGRMALAMKTTIPQAEFALLASAEETGCFRQGLEFLAKSVDQIESMQTAIFDACRTAIIPIFMLIGMLYGADAAFFPSIEESLPRKSWPFITTLVASIAHDIGSLVVVGAIAVPGIFALWLFLLPRWTGVGRKIAEWTIFFSKYRDYQCCLFLVNMQFLMEANHPPKESLERILKVSNPYMRWHLNGMLNAVVSKGMNVGDAMLSTGLFNDRLGELLSNYARWSDWHTEIGNIALSSLEMVSQDVKRLGPIVEGSLKLIIALVVMIVFGAGGFALAKVLTAGIS